MNRDLVVGVLSAAGSGGVIGAIAKLLPRTPEARKTSIELAEGAAGIQDRLLRTLYVEVESLRKRLDGYEIERGELRERLAHAEADRDLQVRKNVDLTERVRQLEDEVAVLRGKGDQT